MVLFIPHLMLRLPPILAGTKAHLGHFRRPSKSGFLKFSLHWRYQKFEFMGCTVRMAPLHSLSHDLPKAQPLPRYLQSVAENNSLCAYPSTPQSLSSGASIYDIRREGGGGKKSSKFADKQYIFCGQRERESPKCELHIWKPPNVFWTAAW